MDDGVPETTVGTPRLFTVGHSTHTTDEVIGLLRQHGVDVVVDVRSQPYSRFAPQFNREQIEPIVTRAGFRYLFMGEELGGRQLGRITALGERLDRYPELARLPAFVRGIERLLDGCGRLRVAILCAEEDPTECHRRVWVGHAMRERGVEVWHIRGDGRLDPDEALRRLEPPAGRQLDLFEI